MTWLIHVDLYAGIAGFTLAAERAGFETILFVEKDQYCQKVLRKHWPNVPIVEDIRDVEKIKEIVANATGQGWLSEQHKTGVLSEEIQETSARQSSGADSLSGRRGGAIPEGKQPAILITAGFPCQPFSVAGKRQSERDDRYLWPETIAVIEAIKPKWVLLENVTGIINLALDTVLSDLEGAGYSYETLIIPACAVNAPHRRDRIWIVAHDEQSTSRGGRLPRNTGDRGSEEVAIANTSGIGIQRHGSVGQQEPRVMARKRLFDRPSSREDAISGQSWWAVEPELGRVAHGIPNRVDRLKCLGNAIVPEVAYQIIKVIAGIERFWK